MQRFIPRIVAIMDADDKGNWVQYEIAALVLNDKQATIDLLRAENAKLREIKGIDAWLKDNNPLSQAAAGSAKEVRDVINENGPATCRYRLRADHSVKVDVTSPIYWPHVTFNSLGHANTYEAVLFDFLFEPDA